MLLSVDKNKVHLTCDTCGIGFIKHRKNRLIKQSRHYCCRSCQHESLRTGKARISAEDTCLNRYGVKTTFKSEACKEALKRKFGDNHHMKSEEVKDKVRRTNFEKYSVTNVFAVESVKQKIRDVLLQRYGVEHALQSDVIRTKFEQTCLDKFGVSSPLSSSDVQDKINETIKKKYGVDHLSKSSVVRNNVRKTMLERYGVENVLQLKTVRKLSASQESWNKRIETMKKNKSFNSSKAELLFVETCDRLEFELDKQVKVSKDHRWAVDFYVKNLHVYVQIDGVYWHGLDRSLDEIKKFIKPRDVVIYNKWLTDRQQDLWFKQNNLKLVRFTDKELNEWQQRNELQNQVKMRLEV
jgi:hypothetical protein